MLPNLLFYVVSWMYYEQLVFFYSRSVMMRLHNASYFSCIHEIISAQLVWSSIITHHAEMFEVTLPLCHRTKWSDALNVLFYLGIFDQPCTRPQSTSKYPRKKCLFPAFVRSSHGFLQRFFVRSDFFPHGSHLRCCVHAILLGAVYTQQRDCKSHTASNW